MFIVNVYQPMNCESVASTHKKALYSPRNIATISSSQQCRNVAAKMHLSKAMRRKYRIQQINTVMYSLRLLVCGRINLTARHCNHTVWRENVIASEWIGLQPIIHIEMDSMGIFKQLKFRKKCVINHES